MKFILLPLIMVAVLLFSGPKDATHQLLHGFESHAGDHHSAASEIRPAMDPTCWIEQGLQHRSIQLPVLSVLGAYLQKTCLTVLFTIDQQFPLSSQVDLTWQARGPPNLSFLLII